ncbi:hypothetical protein L7F22_058434 [Adiantum nelumboides]|nr:hypothetical protein [Adiantum nelumboides]
MAPHVNIRLDGVTDATSVASVVAAGSVDQPPVPVVGVVSGVSVLNEVHNLEIPPIPCSFPWRNHPDYKELTVMSDAWVLSNFTNMPGADGRPSSFAAENIIKSAFHMQATLPFADGISERMPPIIKMMDCPWHLVRVLTDTAAEWWAEMCVGMPPSQKARLRQAFCDYLEANRLQVPFRNSRHLPDVEHYFKVRADSIGWWPCAVLIEHCQGFEQDDEALSNPLLMKLQENTVQHIFLVNDITSFKKEYMQGDFCNKVSILYFRKLYDRKRDLASPAPTLQGALLEALQMIKEKDDECVRLMAEIRKDEHLMKKKGMVEYLEGLGLWMSGTIYWHLGSNSEHTPINLQHVRQARMRSTHHIGPFALHPMTPSSPAAHTIEVAPLEESDEDPSDMMLESEMNDMVEAIFEATDPTADDMKQEARTALYEGSRISRLKTVLALLNLQASFGWSDKSVTELFRWEQQRRAARARIDAGSLHHLGSGGWGSFDEDFQGTTGRAASRLERSLGAQHRLAWVIELLDRRGGESPYMEPLTRAELPDPP